MNSISSANFDILKNINESILILDIDFNIIWFSNKALNTINTVRMSGDSPFCSLFANYHELKRCPLIPLFGEAQHKENVKFMQKINLRKSQKLTARPIPDEKNQQGWYVTIKDRERQIELENFINQTHNRFQAVFEAYPHPLLVFDERMGVIFCNSNGLQMLNLKPKVYFGTKLHEISFFTRLADFRSDISEVIEDNQAKSETFYLDDRILNIDIFPLFKCEKNSEYGISIADVTEERQLERRVRLLFKAIDNSKEGIAILSDKFEIIYSNPAFIEHIGEPENMNSFKFTDIFAKDERFADFWDALQRSIATSHSFSSEILWNNEGKTGVFDLFISKIMLAEHQFSGYLCSIRDISIQKVFERRLAETQKIESLGNLTRSFVHDFNNILSSISGSAELIEKKARLNDIDTILKLSAIIRRSVSSGSKMLDDLLHFTKVGFSEFGEVSVKGVIKRAMDIVSPSMDGKVKFNYLVSESLPTIVGDEMKLIEVFVNLFINANDAMPEGGEISLLTSSFVIDDENIWDFPEGKRGSFIKIDVKDTGIGIRDDDKGKIFEPFFSTKHNKPVAGLGLSIVEEIIRKHSGFINVSSEATGGTIFHIYLPCGD